MSAIVGLVSVTRKNVGPDSRDGQLLGTALDQAMRVTRIVDNLRQLASTSAWTSASSSRWPPSSARRRGPRGRRGPGGRLAACRPRGRGRAGAGRSGAGAAARRSPPQQRGRRDAEGRVDPGRRERGGGRRREALGVRHGTRDPRGDAGAHLRPVLHAQGARRRRWARPHPRELHRRGPSREAARRERRSAAARSRSCCRRPPRTLTCREGSDGRAHQGNRGSQASRARSGAPSRGSSTSCANRSPASMRGCASSSASSARP